MATTPFSVTKWESVLSRSTITPLYLRPVAFFSPTVEFIDIAKNNSYLVGVTLTGNNVYEGNYYGTLYPSSTFGIYFIVIETTFISVPTTLGIITLAPYTNPITTTITVTTATYGTANASNMSATYQTSGTFSSTSVIALPFLTGQAQLMTDSKNLVTTTSNDVTTIESVSSGALSTSMVNTRVTNYVAGTTLTLAAATSGFVKRVTFVNDRCARTLVTFATSGTAELDPSSCLDYEFIYNVDKWYVLYSNTQQLTVMYVTTQQGSKLVGTGATGASAQGGSVSCTYNGDMLVTCGSGDNGAIGAFWTFTRSAGTWTQLGSKVVPTGYTGTPNFGYSCCMTPDGTRLIVGGYADNANVGAAWVFSFASNTWTQEAGPLIGTGAVGASFQGISVAISSNGDTIAVGGRADNANQGAVWMYTRSNTTWTQQGSKLVGTGNTGAALQGNSVALSGDGNTLAEGGSADNGNIGATWIFTRSGSTWTQQGSKLVGTGSVNTPKQGTSASLSIDGNTLAVGGPEDDSSILRGAAWIFNRIGTTWTQQQKCVGSGSTGPSSLQGTANSLSLTADGNSYIVGASADNTNIGAFWIFARRGQNNGWFQIGSKTIPSGGATARFGACKFSANGNTAIIGGFNDNGTIGATWVYI